MARILPINYLLLLITLIYVVRAAPYGLPGDFSSLIPACAAVCFQSFLSVSFGDNAPASLESLCSRIGASDFTLGEAAVQCLVAERAVGYCSNKEASDTIINKAYYMCYGQPNALQPTHTVITATLAIPQYGSGPITFPPTRTGSLPTAIPASRSGSASLTLPTTLVTDPTSLSSIQPSVGTTSPRPTSAPPSQTQAPLPVPTTTSEATTLMTSTKITTSAAVTSTSTEAPAAGAGGDGDKKKSTSSGTIAGVAVGVIAGVAFFAIGIAVFLRYMRRKKFRQWRMAGKNGGPPSRDTWGYNIEKGPNGGGGTDSWITNQLRAPLDPNPPPPPKSYSRASWRPSAIGLAISPSFSRDVSRAATPTRRMSRLLPAKPIMNGGSKANGPAEDQEHLMTGAAMAGVAAAGIAVGVPAATSQAVQARNLTNRDKPHPPLPRLHIQIPQTRASKIVAPAGPGLESTITEFEEDGKTVSPGGGLIWRPPRQIP
ncbi:hypothetical protein PT974_05792 [Cladobotryum mycophilum]|uniref:Mid2 domain-containing protein n=1 Tax=Cladobotryum mycophilum TaxID=491253 RepID=A0ABR0SJT2_9HYPO